MGITTGLNKSRGSGKGGYLGNGSTNLVIWGSYMLMLCMEGCVYQNQLASSWNETWGPPDFAGEQVQRWGEYIQQYLHFYLRTHRTKHQRPLEYNSLNWVQLGFPSKSSWPADLNTLSPLDSRPLHVISNYMWGEGNHGLMVTYIYWNIWSFKASYQNVDC